MNSYHSISAVRAGLDWEKECVSGPRSELLGYFRVLLRGKNHATNHQLRQGRASDIVPHEKVLHHRELPARRTTRRSSCTTASPATCRSSTTTATCRRGRSPRTTASRTSTQIWLDGDHYKWRAMRAAGVAERFCTGDASDWEKFQKWAETVPKTLRNPLYHWTHLELKRPFGISDRLLGPDTAQGIWDECNAMLARAGVLLPRHHAADERGAGLHDRRPGRHAGAPRGDRRRPVVRDPACCPPSGPTRRMAVESPAAFNAWVERLADGQRRRRGRPLRAASWRPSASGTISSTPMGCRLSDHGLETVVRRGVHRRGAAGAVRAGPPRRAALAGRESPSSSRPCSTSWP